jgi:hypothetical protein
MDVFKRYLIIFVTTSTFLYFFVIWYESQNRLQSTYSPKMLTKSVCNCRLANFWTILLKPQSHWYSIYITTLAKKTSTRSNKPLPH